MSTLKDDEPVTTKRQRIYEDRKIKLGKGLETDDMDLDAR